jgi:CRP-like cAMP-binding protein
MNLLENLVKKLEIRNLLDQPAIFKRNEVLVKQGSTNSTIYYILSGTMRVFVTDGEEENVIRFGYEGSIITALDTFVTGKPTELTIQAIKQSIVRSISKDTFMSFIREEKEHAELWMNILQNLIYQQMEREQDLLTSSPSARYNRVLQRSPRLFQEIPHKHIASYLRMTPETLSRIKKS